MRSSLFLSILLLLAYYTAETGWWGGWWWWPWNAPACRERATWTLVHVVRIWPRTLSESVSSPSWTDQILASAQSWKKPQMWQKGSLKVHVHRKWFTVTWRLVTMECQRNMDDWWKHLWGRDFGGRELKCSQLWGVTTVATSNRSERIPDRWRKTKLPELVTVRGQHQRLELLPQNGRATHHWSRYRTWVFIVPGLLICYFGETFSQPFLL